MKRFFLLAPMLPLVAAAPAAPPAPAWDSGVFEGSPMCFVARDFPDGTSLTLAAARSERLWLAIGRHGWKTQEELTYALSFEVDGLNQPTQPAWGLRSAGRMGYLVQVTPSFVRALARGASLRLAHPESGQGVEVSLAGSSSAAAQLRACHDRLPTTPAPRRPHSEVEPTPLRDPFRRNNPFPRRPVGSLNRYFTGEDYPTSALRAGHQGRSSFLAEVGPDGRVTSCMITGTSGSAALDLATCRIVQRRARLLPALDAKGEPVSDSIGATIVWRLDDALPALPAESTGSATQP